MENVEQELDWVERLAQTMTENKLHKLEFETENVSLTLRSKQAAPAPPPPPPAASSSAPEEDVEGSDVILFCSKDVGIFRVAEDLSPGTVITEGQKVGTVEAVSVEHDLIADCSGVLVEMVVQDGDPVEYGQPLLVISESEN